MNYLELQFVQLGAIMDSICFSYRKPWTFYDIALAPLSLVVLWNFIHAECPLK